MNVYKTTGLSLLLFMGTVTAGELVKDSQIVRIGNSSNGVDDNFFITMSGGEGPCAVRRQLG